MSNETSGEIGTAQHRDNARRRRVAGRARRDGIAAPKSPREAGS